MVSHWEKKGKEKKKRKEKRGEERRGEMKKGKKGKGKKETSVEPRVNDVTESQVLPHFLCQSIKSDICHKE